MLTVPELAEEFIHQQDDSDLVQFIELIFNLNLLPKSDL